MNNKIFWVGWFFIGLNLSLYSCNEKRKVSIIPIDISSDSLFNIGKQQHDNKAYPQSYFIFTLYKKKYHYSCWDDFYIAWSLWGMDKFDEAMKHAKLASKCGDVPKDKIYNLLGVLMLSSHKYEQAYYFIQKASELNPKDGTYYNNLGVTLSLWKPLERSQICYFLKKAIEHGDSSSLNYYIIECDIQPSMTK
jgi:tetratricopeptide (TPR) repeat protein